MLGIGTGVGAGIFAQIARTTTEQERTGMFSIAMALRQFGLLVGVYLFVNDILKFCCLAPITCITSGLVLGYFIVFRRG